ncbi:MAG: hypothetical protein LBS60_09005 [Deltaproteobacteria bacterium]|jgi:hypothetical protein|nr:hypothetical protein [Deltaproteobacteria bacterium]
MAKTTFWVLLLILFVTSQAFAAETKTANLTYFETTKQDLINALGPPEKVQVDEYGNEDLGWGLHIYIGPIIPKENTIYELTIFDPRVGRKEFYKVHTVHATFSKKTGKLINLMIS